MTIHLNTHPDDRKDMVKAISERTCLDAAYMGPPSFAYQIGAATVNRDGTIDYEQDPSMDGVIPLLIERGWLDPGEYDLGAGETDASAQPISEQPADVTAVAIRLPLEGWTVQEAKNLLRLVCSKQYLIRRMTGNDDLYLSSTFTNAICAKIDHESIADIQADLKAGMERSEVAGVSLADDAFMMAFPYDELEPTRWEAIGELMRGMMHMAKAATRVSLDTRVTEENEKYYARSWLVRMGYGGPEHKELRAVLLKHLKGYAAFKSEADMQAHKDKYAALHRERRDTDPVRRDKTNVNAILVILICLAAGAVIGVWQGFWIGNVHIPPFICTLAGMFLFRGLGRVVLGSKTVSINNQLFLNIFASYITVPGLDADVKWSAFIVGVIVAAALLLFTVTSRAKKARKGYKMNSAVSAFGKIAVIDALILVYTWKLAHYKGIPVMALWVLAVILIYAFITSKTAFGRYFYAVGGNEKATKLSGIDTKRVYFMAYASMSFLAGLSGLLMAARIGSVNGDTGTSFEMDAIGSCFIGGASAYGGSGTVPGIMVGAILLGVINQGMSIIGLDNNWQYVVKGAVLLVAVIFDVVSNHKTGKAG